MLSEREKRENQEILRDFEERHPEILNRLKKRRKIAQTKLIIEFILNTMIAVNYPHLYWLYNDISRVK